MRTQTWVQSFSVVQGSRVLSLGFASSNTNISQGRIWAPLNLGMLQICSCLLRAFSSPINCSLFSQSQKLVDLWHCYILALEHEASLRKRPNPVWQEACVPVPASRRAVGPLLPILAGLSGAGARGRLCAENHTLC